MFMPRLRSSAAGLVLASSVVACAHPGHGTPERHDPVAVRAAMRRADARAIASMFAEDGEYIVAATKGFVTGRMAIEELFAARFKAVRFTDVAVTTISVQVEGDTAYETGTNRLTFQAGDAAPVTRTGRYPTVWKQQVDGAWRIRVDAIIPDPSP
jgi:uncharacterized protein (TIGR02246 family)